MAYRDSTLNVGVDNTAVGTWPTAPLGDYVAAVVVNDNSAVTQATPAGWTLRANADIAAPDSQRVRYYDLDGGSSGSPPALSWVLGGVVDWLVIVVSLSGRNLAAPRTFVTATTNTDDNASPIAGSLTSGTAAAGDDVLGFVLWDNSTSGSIWSSAWAALSEREDGPSADWISGSLATEDAVSAGAFGTVSVTGTRTAGSGNAGYSGFVAAVAASSETKNNRHVRAAPGTLLMPNVKLSAGPRALTALARLRQVRAHASTGLRLPHRP